MAKKRNWSREFTPRGAKIVNLNITGVPPTLREKFRAKCRRINKSQRNVILSWVRNWVEGRRPDEDRPADDPLHTPAHPDGIGVETPVEVSLR
jgi:hypothetical protein